MDQEKKYLLSSAKRWLREQYDCHLSKILEKHSHGDAYNFVDEDSKATQLLHLQLVEVASSKKSDHINHQKAYNSEHTNLVQDTPTSLK